MVTYTLYRIVLDGRTIHVGITMDPARRLREHQRSFGARARMVEEGIRYSLEGARMWEDAQRRKGRPTGP